MQLLNFRKKGSDLPLAAPSAGSSSYGGKANGITGMTVVNKSVALSILWVLLSIAMVFYGIRHCSNNSYNYQLKCGPDDCVFIKTDPIKDENFKLEFIKADLLRVDAVRIDEEGRQVDSIRMRAEPRTRYGHSMRLQIKVPAEEGSTIKITKDILFSPRDMSRRPTRSGSAVYKWDEEYSQLEFRCFCNSDRSTVDCTWSWFYS